MELRQRIDTLRRFERNVEHAELALASAKRILKMQRDRLDRENPGWEKLEGTATVTSIDRKRPERTTVKGRAESR